MWGKIVGLIIPFASKGINKAGMLYLVLMLSVSGAIYMYGAMQRQAGAEEERDKYQQQTSEAVDSALIEAYRELEVVMAERDKAYQIASELASEREKQESEFNELRKEREEFAKGYKDRECNTLDPKLHSLLKRTLSQE